MNCPECKKELLAIINNENENILPLRQNDKLFPIEIIVSNNKIYKCNCGVKIEVPNMKHYYQFEEGKELKKEM